MTPADDLPPILWKLRGIYVALSGSDWNRLPNGVQEGLIALSTPQIKKFDRDNPKLPPKIIEVPLLKHLAASKYGPEIRLPHGGYSKYTELLRENQIESIRSWKNQAVTHPLDLEAALHHKPHPEKFQMEILQACSDGNKESGLSSGIVEAGMGGGKTLIGTCLIFGLRHLRPAVICGWREKDTQQIYEALNKYMRDNPQYHEPVILHLPTSGANLKEKQREILEGGQGIMVCTQKGLQQAPLNTKLLVIDEYHNLATELGITKIQRLRLLERCYGLSGTVNLRSDGGDKLIQFMTGPVLIKKKHVEIEKTGRVTPVNIHGYHFVSRGERSIKNGYGRYYHDERRPEQSPAGYNEEHALIENHSGRSRFICDLIKWLPKNEVKVVFAPHVSHAVLLEKFIRYECRGYDPVLIHAQADKDKRNYLDPKEKKARRAALLAGEIKLAICTDVLSTGVDTNVIDHTIDTTGKLQLITSIQRSGRSVRPRIKDDGSYKIAQIHIILDKNFDEMNGPHIHLDPVEVLMKEAYESLGKKSDEKMKALLRYYGYPPAATYEPEKQSQPELLQTETRTGGGIIYPIPPWLHPEIR